MTTLGLTGSKFARSDVFCQDGSIVLATVPLLLFDCLMCRKKKTAGFSIEGGTRRLIAAYFGIYSRLLCVEVAFLCFVLTPLALLKSLLLYQ